MSGPILLAHTQLVAIAAIKEILGGADYVGATLPNDNTKWQTTGFVQVLDLVGSRDMDTDFRSPIVSIDVWGVGLPGSNRPPVQKTKNLVSTILKGAFKWLPHRVTLPGSYPNARVHTIIVNTEPREVPDLQSYIHINFHLLVNWTEVTS